LGAALAALGQRDQAGVVLDQAVTVASRLGMPRALAEAFETQAHLAETNDEDQAVELHHEALALRAEHGLRTFSVDSLEALAAIDGAAGSSSEAVRVLAAAAQARDAMGYPRHPAQQRIHERASGRLQTVLGDPAFAEAWAEGTLLSLDDAVAYVRRGRGARGRPAAGWGSLTPTELEVVRLAVEGLNNPEIGKRLFMSRGTVKTHLSHVYAKLGVANRTELATVAAPRL
jgi:DNA-binding CsgD family transcriptional regulator